MKIECTLPFASSVISGIAFEPSEAGTMVSVDDVGKVDAERLLRIDGFREVKEAAPPAPPAAPAAKVKKEEPAPPAEPAAKDKKEEPAPPAPPAPPAAKEKKGH